MTSPYMRITSAFGTVDLNGIAQSGVGTEAQPGVTGLGLPPIEVAFSTSAGDGSTYIGRRVGSRTVEVPVAVAAADRAGLRSEIRTLTKIVTAEEVTLWWIDATLGTYSIKARLIEGGDYVYGSDDGTFGEQTARTTYKFQSDDPYWVAATPTTATWATGSSGPTSVTLTITNPGSAPAYPIWVMDGGVDWFSLELNGKKFRYDAPIPADATLTVDAGRGTVVDETGANRYSSLGLAPHFFSLPPGSSNVTWEFQRGTVSAAPRVNYVLNPDLAPGSGTWTIWNPPATAGLDPNVLARRQSGTDWGIGAADNSGYSGTARPYFSTEVPGLTIGTPYTFSMDMVTREISGNLLVEWLDTGGAVVSTRTFDLAYQFPRGRATFDIGEAATAKARLTVYPPAHASGSIYRLYYSWFGMFYLGGPGSYFTGSFADTASWNYSWSGTANASTSLATESVPTSADLSLSLTPLEWLVI